MILSCEEGRKADSALAEKSQKSACLSTCLSKTELERGMRPNLSLFPSTYKKEK